MPKRSIHFLILTLIVLSGVVAAYVFFSRSMNLPSATLAKTPAPVGDKAAPIPVLKVEDISLESKGTVSAAQIRRSINSSVPGQSAVPTFELTEYQLKWNVTVEDGSMQPVVAQVFAPNLPAGQTQKLPVIIYGAGTTGLADRCAPSRENLSRGNMGDFRNYIISEASQGFVVVLPNYEGFDNPNRTQHYFNKDSEARTMLSAGKAMVSASPKSGIPINTNGVFFGGYSQGGHAAFSAADYASIYTPDLKVAGVFGHGPTTNIENYLISNPNLAAYFVASYSDYYPAIEPATLLKPEWVGYLSKARQICVDEGFGNGSTTFNRVYSDAFGEALKNKSLPTSFPEISKVFVENNAGTDYTKIPTFIVQGTIDTIVTEANQQTFVDELCKRNVPVNLKKYRVQHFSTRQVSFKDTNAWINAVAQGQAVPNTCN